MPPATWEKVYLYAWNGANLGAWPGMEWTTQDAEGWLYHVFPGDVREVSIIFTNGAGEQSSDILLDQDACYEWNGMEVLSQNCSLSDIPFSLIVSPEGQKYKTESLTISMTTVGEKSTPTIYYTLDNSDPKTSSTKQTYTVPFTIQGNKTLKAYAVDGNKETEVQTHTYTYQAPQKTALVVKFMPPASWTTVYLYAWDMSTTPLMGEWPGTEWTTKDENDWLYHTFPEEMREVNVIFNNGESVQTADLYVDSDVCYIWNEDEQKAEIDLECSGSDVENVEAEKTIPALDINLPMFNILGQQVSADYQGVVIQNGYKYIR
jgi:hypothetical protein